MTQIVESEAVVVEGACEKELALVPTVEQKLPTDRDPVTVYIGSLPSIASRHTMMQSLREAADLLQVGADPRQIAWWRLGFQHTSRMQRALIDRGLKARTVNKTMSAVRGVLRASFDLGMMSHDAFVRASRIKTLRADTLLIGRQVGHDEVAQLYSHCLGLKTPNGTRDAALIAALVGAGLRRAEAVHLGLTDYDHAEQSLRVIGKGKKERIAYLMPDDASVIEAWIGVRGPADGPLFCPVRKNGTVSIRAMTEQAVYASVVKRAKQLGLKHFSPHSLRRTLITSLLEAGVDILQVQDQVGHASPMTTKRYDLRPDAARRAAIRTRLRLVRGGKRDDGDGETEGWGEEGV